MKKIVFTALITFLSTSAFGQLFELTYNGFVDAQNKDNNYVVVPFEGKTQQDIFPVLPLFQLVG